MELKQCTNEAWSFAVCDWKHNISHYLKKFGIAILKFFIVVQA